MLWLNLYWTSILTLACVNAVAAVGLQMILASGQFSVMQAAVMASGAYGSAYAELAWHVSFTVALVAGAVVGALIGAVTALVLLRLSGLFFGIATLALGQAGYYLVQVIPGLGGPGGLVGVNLSTSPNLALGTLVVVLVVYSAARKHPAYVRVLAAGADPVAAEALAIDPWRIRLIAFTCGSALAGLAGGLYVHYVGLIQPPDLSFGAESLLLIYVVAGGLQTPFGAVLGAIGVSVLLELLRASDQDRYWMLGAILVIVTLLRPQGLLPRRRLRARSYWTAALRQLRPEAS
jgi:branched-chain amino acid transport system permease protein